MLQVLDATERITGRAVPQTISDRRNGDPVATYADPSLARSTIGWSAKYGLDEIIQSAYDWHRSQI